MDIFKNAGLEKCFNESCGWAVFKNIGKAGWLIGAAGGKGQVFLRQAGGRSPKLVGASSVVQLTVGFQLGGQVCSEIIFFETKADFDDFTSGNFELGAEAQVAAIAAGANAKATTAGSSAGASGGHNNACVADSGCSDGKAIFTVTKGGLMHEASVGGQRFGHKPMSCPPCPPVHEEHAQAVETAA